eukprot:m.74578 g.74578  ORF g.74578 m.74578 type:complete len:65 (-) comp12402_c0_seq2:933-1127(-)
MYEDRYMNHLACRGAKNMTPTHTLHTHTYTTTSPVCATRFLDCTHFVATVGHASVHVLSCSWLS